MLICDASQFRASWSQNFSDLDEVLALRKACFPGVRDILSPADLRARHLLIRDGANRLVGTYRVTLSTEVLRFEAEDDFILRNFLKRAGIKAELSWACVAPEFRDGKVIHLLWRALADFFKEHRVRYVFGLASVSSVDKEHILNIVGYLKHHSFLAEENLIQARRAAFSSSTLAFATPTMPLRKRILPGLLRAYLMAGAQVCVQPVFDPDIDCYDFMTVLDTENASGPLVSHFNFSVGAFSL